MMNSELNECPFCGVKKTWIRRKLGMYYIQCESCGSSTGYWFTIDQAIEAWNTRIKSIDTSVKERTCHMELRKQGMVYDVFYFDCCDKEYVENKCDGQASKISGDVCPYCGAEVVEK